MKASALNSDRTPKFMAALPVASVAGLLGVALFGAGQASSAEATQYTCDGRTATMVITSYGNYLGTSGDDVIVMDIPISQAGAHLDALGGDDVICGSSQADTISGGSGKDTIFGKGGDDCIGGDEDVFVAGYGDCNLNNNVMVVFGNDDEIHGGPGNDVIYGHIGDDIIWGGNGADDIWGGDGGDEIHGEDGNDDLRGDGGDDEMHGGPDNDDMWGENGNDTMRGNDGDDDLFGGDDGDDLFGGDGADTLDGEGGGDSCDGGPGNDTLNSC